MDRDKNLAAYMQGSHAVDEAGNPLRLYHGTADDFSEFRHEHPNKKDAGWLGKGFYFSNSPAMANSYAMLKPGKAENVMPVHLSLRNPFYATMEHKTALKNALLDNPYAAEEFRNQLIEAGHDGVILDYGTKDNVKEYVAFHPTQIKSATGNQGTFDPSEPDITKADGGEVEDYRGQHEAPGPGYGMPLHDTTDVYPKDFYGPNGFDYYANYGGDYDRKAYNTAVRLNGDPEAHVWIHRAVPTAVYKAAMKTDAPLAQLIKKGDWVTPTKEYARDHGKSVLNGDYKIASKRVKAKEVFTNGDSIHEWGYHPAVEKADGGVVSDEDEGLTAYHGSPHDFEQFDVSKIGTGEGAQSYGHGLYFAGNEDVARDYRDRLGRQDETSGETMADQYVIPRHFYQDTSEEELAENMKEAARWSEQQIFDQGKMHYVFDDGSMLIHDNDEVRAVQKHPGHMYEVHINAHPDHFLDWDEVLEDQNPHIKAALQRVADHDEAEKGYTDLHEHLADPDAYTGGAFYQNLADRGRAKEASEILSQMGIKGIRYKDAGSRFKNEKLSYNYVVFNHDHVKVRRKYMLGGAV